MDLSAIYRQWRAKSPALDRRHDEQQIRRTRRRSISGTREKKPPPPTEKTTSVCQHPKGRTSYCFWQDPTRNSALNRVDIYPAYVMSFHAFPKGYAFICDLIIHAKQGAGQPQGIDQISLIKVNCHI
ncbi:hypothetical protein GWI33_000589 [Rhynchophorus ferrugineus]|uniref:Uncharacterized protein n=1 Tax=Rhynchophorus ferrugineus TaxID=354439 RepID=A0A834HL34_RHYFE|nr:hypothetical protein GWI33_000589 [Rhynchophorus ferrugineus]